MNSLKRRLFPFSVLRSPFSLIRVLALSPGVMAVFNHEDAREGGPSIVRAAPVKPPPMTPCLAPDISDLAVAAKHRATSFNDLNAARARLKSGPGGRLYAVARAVFAWRPGLFFNSVGGTVSAQGNQTCA